MKVRSLVAAILAALLVPAAASAAPIDSKAGSISTVGSLHGLSVGGFAGYEQDDVSGYGLRLDAELPFRALLPGVNLSWIGSFGYSRLDFENVLDFDVLRLVPAARFSVPVNSKISLFMDGGVGVFRASYKEKMVGGTETVSDSEVNWMMRFAGGAFWQLNDRTRLGAMLELAPLFGDFHQVLFSVQGGAMFRL